MAIEVRQPHLCECGQHAFAHLTRAGVALVSPEDMPLLAQRPCKRVSAGTYPTQEQAAAAYDAAAARHVGEFARLNFGR